MSKTKLQAINDVLSIVSVSSDIRDFGARLFEYTGKEIDSELANYFNYVFLSLLNNGVKLTVSEGIGVFRLVGGGNINDYNIEKLTEAAGQSLGFYTPTYNLINLSGDENAIEGNKVEGYGLDAYLLQENFMLAYISILLHEALHALATNNQPMDVSDNNDVIWLKTEVSKAAKMNKLDYLKVIDAHWQEIISHIVSNKRYYNWIEDNNYSFQLSKVFSSVFTDKEERLHVIGLVNEWTKMLYGTNTNIVFDVSKPVDIDTFMGRNYYDTHKENILGIEKTTTNRWGKFVFKTSRYSEDRSIDDIFNRIPNLPAIDFASLDNLEKVDKYDDSFDANEIEKSIDESIEKQESGQVEYSESGLVTFTESVKKYNIDNGNLSWLEIEAYLYCNPGENKHLWRENFEYNDSQILESMSSIILNKNMENECEITVPTVIFDGDDNIFFSVFLHGDVYEKTIKVKANKEVIIAKYGANYYSRLEKGLGGVKFVSVTFDNEDYNKRPYISPVSDIAKEYMVSGYIGARTEYETQLIRAFSDCIQSRTESWFKSSRYAGVSYIEMIKAIKGDRLVEVPYRGSKKNLTKGQISMNEEADNKNAAKFDMVFSQTCVAFSDFIKECIKEEDKKKIEDEISGFYNKFCFTDYSKVPVAFTHSSRFKRIKNFGVREVQRDAIAFHNINHTGLLAHEVGVGKTISSLMTISNSFDTGRAKKALISVPKPVYEKWIKECQNYKQKIEENGETKEVTMYGMLPHINVVGLGNLNDNIIITLKEYTQEEKDKIANAKSGFIKFKEQVEKQLTIDNSQFDDEESEEENESKLKINLPKGFKDIDKLNSIVSSVDIAVMEPFGITNEENKTINSIHSIISSQISNNTIPPNITEFYSKAGVKLNDVEYASDIEENVHYSVIMSIIYKFYSRLESHYIVTLGTMRSFPDNTIFFVTHYGMERRFGFKDDTIQMMTSKLFEILQGSEVEDADQAKIEQNIETILKRAEFEAKIYMEDFGFDFISIDEAHNYKNLIPSVTQSKKLGEKERKEEFPGNKGQFKSISGSQSNKALVAFMTTMYIQMKNGGKNTLLLTATPFTNSPLEIFSILALTNYNYLSRLGYRDVMTFAQEFIKVKSQLSIDPNGAVKMDIQPVGYNNLSLLRRIIYTVIDFRMADEANVNRPCKITIPLKEKSKVCDSRSSVGFSALKPVSSIVIPTNQQQLIFDALQLYLSTQTNSRTVDEVFRSYIMGKGGDYYKKVTFSESGIDHDDYMTSVTELAEHIKTHFNVTKKGQIVDQLIPSVAILKVLMAMRHASISPMMFRPYVQDYIGLEEKDVDYNQVISQSSKLMYVVTSIKKLNKINDELGKDRKGFVIYSNLGAKKGKVSPIALLPALKKHFLDEENGYGYKKKSIIYEKKNPETGRTTKLVFDDVEIMMSASSSRKEPMMELFNSGKIKVILGTSSIKEGVDLNGNTSALFNISVDWNPTDAKQVEGRAWRQGNRNAYVAIIYPLTANGSDMALYQKLQDKTYRLKAIWDKSEKVKSAFDLDDFNPEELKMEMISRVEKLAPFIFAEETAKSRYEYDILKSKKEEAENIINSFRGYNDNERIFRYAMKLFTSLPKIFEHSTKINNLKKEIDQSINTIAILESRLNEEKGDSPSFKRIIDIDDYINSLNLKIKDRAAGLGIAVVEGDTDRESFLRDEIGQFKKSIAKLEDEKATLESKVEEEVGEALKEVNADIKKEKKDLEKLNEKLETLESSNPIENIEIKADVELNSIGQGNYFMTKEDGRSVIYKHKGTSLDSIDWVNKATTFDLFEGVKRLTDSYININSSYSVAFSEAEDYINLKKYNDEYNLLPEDVYDNLMNDTLRTYGDEARKWALLQYAKDFVGGSYNRTYWNIFYVMNMKVSILRSLKEYHSVVEGKDPDEFIKELNDQLDKMYKEIGETEDIMSISDEVIEKYINKAYEIISERRKNYENYTNLVDGLVSFSDLFNISMEEITEEPKTEMVDKVTIEYAKEVKKDSEKEAEIELYTDKIEVYREMIEEGAGNAQKYQDKIEVYEEMIEELKN